MAFRGLDAVFLPFVGRQRAHGERVNFLAHALTERGVDQLVALDAAFSRELRGNHHRLEMLAVADHLDVVAGEPAFDSLLDAVRSDQWRFSFSMS